jgi:hypothetical protein
MRTSHLNMGATCLKELSSSAVAHFNAAGAANGFNVSSSYIFLADG